MCLYIILVSYKDTRFDYQFLNKNLNINEMKKIIVFLFALSPILFFAQTDYSSAIGLRGGSTFGVTYKVLLDSEKYIELIANYDNENFGASALYEIPKILSKQLNWYYGFGASAGFGNDEDNDFGVAVGVSGIVGIEYIFKEIPINLSIDYLPTLNLININDGDDAFEKRNFALSVRYILR